MSRRTSNVAKGLLITLLIVLSLASSASVVKGDPGNPGVSISVPPYDDKEETKDFPPSYSGSGGCLHSADIFTGRLKVQTIAGPDYGEASAYACVWTKIYLRAGPVTIDYQYRIKGLLKAYGGVTSVWLSIWVEDSGGNILETFYLVDKGLPPPLEMILDESRSDVWTIDIPSAGWYKVYSGLACYSGVGYAGQATSDFLVGDDWYAQVSMTIYPVGGPTLHLVIPTENAYAHDIATAIKDELAKIGINVVIEYRSASEIADTVWETGLGGSKPWEAPGEGWDMA